MRKVAITAVGAISGCGVSAKQNWETMLAGKAPRSKISAATHFDMKPLAKACTARGGLLVDTVCASPHTNQELAQLAGVTPAKRYDRHQLLAFVAAEEAMDNMTVGDACDPVRFGLYGGTGAGGLQESADAHHLLYGGKGLMPTANLRLLPNTFAGYLANSFGIQGPGAVHVTACAASLHALMQAADHILLGRIDMALVVGTDASITPFGIASFVAQGAVGNEILPYQARRQTFLMGEGAAAMIVEDYDHAKARGAEILAVMHGWASTQDGVEGAQITDPNAERGAQTARLALQMAGIMPGHLGFIKTHGTGTIKGDSEEMRGIGMWMADALVPIWAPKSYSGHLLGAAGAFEVVMAIMALRHKLVPSTYGLRPENMDPAFEGFEHVMGSPRVLMHPYALCNSFGFGGTNGTVVLGAP